MSVFDTAKNMTPPATKVGSSQAVNAEYSRKTEQDNFKIIHVTQSRMDKLSGSEGFLTYTRPSTKELFIVRGLPKPIRDIALGFDRKRMRDGIKGPGLRGNSVRDLIAELQRTARRPQSFLRGVGTPARVGRAHGGPIYGMPAYPSAIDYLGGFRGYGGTAIHPRLNF
jgi:hypothetical protein